MFPPNPSSPGEAYFPSPIERAAAAQVLSGELTRFKRVVSERVNDRPGKGAGGKIITAGAASPSSFSSDKEVTKGGVEGGQRGAGRVLVRLGGFKALDQSVAVTREVADFCRAVEEVKKNAAAAAAAAAVAPPTAAAAADAGVGMETGEGSDVSGGCGGEGGGGGGASVRAKLFEPAFLLILHGLEVRSREPRG